MFGIPYEPDEYCLKNDKNKPFSVDYKCRSCGYLYEHLTVWNGSACVTCAEYNPNTPFWNGKTCIDTCKKPDEYGRCIFCQINEPYWDGEECRPFC